MKIITAILTGGLIVAAGGVLYDTTFEVQDLEGRLSRLNRQIVAEREVIQVLKADWSVLNDIARIEDLALRHLPGLRPAEAQQFAALSAVPVPGADGKNEPQVAGLIGRAVGPTVADPVAGKGTSLSAPAPTPPRDGIGALISGAGGVQ